MVAGNRNVTHLYFTCSIQVVVIRVLVCNLVNKYLHPLRYFYVVYWGIQKRVFIGILLGK